MIFQAIYLRKKIIDSTTNHQFTLLIHNHQFTLFILRRGDEVWSSEYEVFMEILEAACLTFFKKVVSITDPLSVTTKVKN